MARWDSHLARLATEPSNEAVYWFASKGSDHATDHSHHRHLQRPRPRDCKAVPKGGLERRAIDANARLGSGTGCVTRCPRHEARRPGFHLDLFGRGGGYRTVLSDDATDYSAYGPPEATPTEKIRRQFDDVRFGRELPLAATSTNGRLVPRASGGSRPILVVP